MRSNRHFQVMTLHHVIRRRETFLAPLSRPELCCFRFYSRRLGSGVKPKTVALAIWTSPEHRTLVNQHLAPPITFWRSFADAMIAGKKAARSLVVAPAGPLALSVKKQSALISR
jgi:hypothetical protein